MYNQETNQEIMKDLDMKMNIILSFIAIISILNKRFYNFVYSICAKHKLSKKIKTWKHDNEQYKNNTKDNALRLLTNPKVLCFILNKPHLFDILNTLNFFKTIDLNVWLNRPCYSIFEDINRMSCEGTRNALIKASSEGGQNLYKLFS